MKNCIAYIFYLVVSISYSQSIIRDPSFGTNGIVNTNYYSNSNNYLMSTFLQNDYKFITTGAGKIVRFNENGSIDTNFGSNGEALLPSSSYVIKNVIFNNNYIFICGSVFNNTTFQDAFIAKYDINGILDPTFGANGITIYNINENEEFNSISFTTDNKIIAVGIKSTNPWHKLFITKFNENGLIDASFQNNGYRELYIFPIYTDRIEDFKNLGNNKFIVACSGLTNINIFNKQLALVQFDEQGNLDSNFNMTGIKVFPPFAYNGLGLAKFYGLETLFIKNSGQTNIYTNALLHKINLNSLTIDNVFSIDIFTYDYHIHDAMSITTLSMDPYICCGNPNRDLNIKKYNTVTGNLDNSFCNDGTWEFNLSDLNNYHTDDIPSNIIFYNDKILISGQSQIPQSGINGLFYVFTKFNQIPLSTISFNNQNNLKIAPNPVKNELNISYSKLAFPIILKIYNTLGQTVKSMTIERNINYNLQLDVSELETNQYNVDIIDNDNNSFKFKFIKLK